MLYSYIMEDIMIEKICIPARNTYVVKVNDLKKDNTYLNANDLVNVGYMAGRYGINLENPNESNPIKYDDKGLKLDINSCTAELFEENLNKAGIKFDKLA